MKINTIRLFVILLAATVLLDACVEKASSGRPDDGQISRQIASFDDDLVATDALGRTLPSYEEAGGVRENHYVGLFYWLWHGDLRNNSQEEWDYNVTESNKRDPGRTDWQYADYYWAKPELGYYRSDDRYVLQKHLNLFCLLGIDFLYLDFTNNLRDTEALKVFLEVIQDFRRRGYDPPRLVPFFNSGRDGVGKDKPYSYLETYYNMFVKDGRYADCWFIYEGKPLIFSPEKHPTNEELNDAFTWRRMWADFGAEDKERWRFFDNYTREPRGPHPAYDSEGRLEQMVISKGLGAPIWGVMKYGGGSSTTTFAPTYDAMLLDPQNTSRGLFFEEQAEQAFRYEPPILCITGWNEWKAGAWPADEALAGAKMKFRGVPVQVGTYYFVDEFNEEFNRDFEPEENPQYSDNFYYQLAAFIRKYKGMNPPQAVSKSKTIHLQKGFAQWDRVRPVFRDYEGEFRSRDNAGAPKGTHYTNDTGRNDIVESRVTYDDRNLYFYVRTSKDITSWQDRNWMLLYIDADKDKETGWEGYDYVINLEVKSDGETTLKQRVDNGWKTLASCPYRVEGAQMQIAVPRDGIGLDKEKPSFYFHWADNIQETDCIREFFLNGDSAPERRYNYYYHAK